MASTWFAQEVWDSKIAQRLDKPQTWKDVVDVVYTDTMTTVLPYISAANEPSTSTTLSNQAARATMTNVVPFADVTEATETLQIVSGEFINVYVDYADQAQSNYAKQAQIAELLGKKVTERVEALTLAGHGDWTDLGDNGSGGVGLASTQFAVTNTSIDDLCRGIIEQIQTANGFDLYMQNGGFVVWRPQDWTQLVTFMQANGFQFADENLRNPNKIGKEALGLNHYVSTGHTANHVFGGVRGVYKLGLLSSTFGKTFVNEHPASSTAGFMSGTAVYQRLDYGRKQQTTTKPTQFDINVTS